ncbi:MAG: flippase [Thermosipho sp. (in: Bacteria)]|nr:flippase [Thermosipho sp. (in: thermotogales)]
MSEYKQYLKLTSKQAGLTFGTRVIGYILGFFLQAIFAKLLGSDKYGLYALGFSLASMGVMFTNFGMTSSMQRFLGEYFAKKEKEKIKSLISSGFLIVTTLNILVFILMYVFKEYISINIFKEPRLTGYFIYFEYILLVLSYVNLLNGIYIGFKIPSVFTFNKEIIERMLRIIIFLSLYVLGIKFFGAVFSTLISSLLLLVILIVYLVKKYGQYFKFKIPERKLTKKVLSFSTNMFFVRFSYFLMSQINILIVGSYLESSKVGIYSISNTIAALSVFFLTSFNSIFGTVISELYHSKKYEVLDKLYSTIVRIIIVLTTPLTIWMVFYSKEILMFFGKDYAEGMWVLIFLALGQYVNAFVGSNGLMLAMTKHQRIELYNGIAIATLNVVLNILLIPKYGIVGSAIAGTIAITSINILKSVEVYFLLGYFPYRKLTKPLSSALLVVLILFLFKTFYINFNILFVASMLGVIYLAYLGIITLSGWEEDDKDLIRALVRRIKRK